MINLTKDEREKFAAYLMQEAKNDKILIDQMEKIKNTPELVIKNMKLEYDAKLTVAYTIYNIETQNVG